jgi:hypothetical protein
MGHSDKVQQCVEALCIRGCDAVRVVIRALEDGLPVTQTNGLDPQERAAVLAELKAIMAVYDRR